jgi:hypothetical protein
MNVKETLGENQQERDGEGAGDGGEYGLSIL